ncbi:MAG: ABC transporter ATP-binding protein [Coriobacteriia bacterium]|nr:ABC transporter ATP-binding protein [Coriobacteriia bacterium]
MLKLLFTRIQKREAIAAILCVVTVIFTIFFDLKLPEYMSGLTVLISTEGDVSEVINYGIRMLICVLGSAVLSIFDGYCAAKCAAGLALHARQELFAHVMDFGQEEMNKFSIPSLITRTTDDFTQVQMYVSMSLVLAVRCPIMAIWAVTKILEHSIELSMVTAIFVVVIMIFVFSVMFIVIPKFRLIQKLTDRINLVVNENLTGINVVHAYNAENYQNEKFDDLNIKITKTQLFNQRLFAALGPLLGLGLNGLSFVIYWVGAALILQTTFADRLTYFSNIVVFSTYATYVLMSFMLLVLVFMLLPQARVSAERILKVLDETIKLKQGSKDHKIRHGSIEFKNVDFKYPNNSKNTLQDINFSIDSGKTLAIIGGTGSGKTSLINLIARLYDTSSGTVTIDGVDVSDYKFESLYNDLAFITQKAVIFSGTVEDNIKFGHSSNKINEIDEYLKLAEAQNFKSNDEISQRGKNISGGQKQRLAIARALARKPKIIIFDDSFSALDYITDAKLRSNLKKYCQDSTKVIVAQRIGTIKDADKILVMKDGKIVGEGRHNELLKENEEYKQIALSQLSPEELGGVE